MNAWKFIKQHRNNIVCYGSLTLVFVLFAILTKGKIYSAYNLKSLVGQMVVLMIISTIALWLGRYDGLGKIKSFFTKKKKLSTKLYTSCG